MNNVRALWSSLHIEQAAAAMMHDLDGSFHLLKIALQHCCQICNIWALSKDFSLVGLDSCLKDVLNDCSRGTQVALHKYIESSRKAPEGAFVQPQALVLNYHTKTFSFAQEHPIKPSPSSISQRSKLSQPPRRLLPQPDLCVNRMAWSRNHDLFARFPNLAKDLRGQVYAM